MINKLRNLKYLTRRVVLLMDVSLSTFATICAYLFLFFVLLLTGRPSSYRILYSMALSSFVVSSIVFYVFNLHREAIRHFAIMNVAKIIALVLLKEIILVALSCYFLQGTLRLPIFSGVVDFLLTIFFLVGTRSIMIALYFYLIDRVRNDASDTVVYSTRGYSPNLVQHLRNDINTKFRIRGFLTTNRTKNGIIISGVPVHYIGSSEEEFDKLFVREGIKSVIFTSQNGLKKERDNLIEYCIRHNIRVYLVGDIQQLDDDGNIPNRSIKPIQIEDLLERQEININNISAEIAGKVVMVTGAAGSIGSELSRQIATSGAKQIILYDIAETPMHNIQLEFTQKYPDVAIEYVLADVRSTRRAKAIVERYKPSIIFHAAAYKHVPMIENNPCEGVIDNVWGTVNMARRAIENGVEKFVMISTDKAVNPTNVMGATKRIAEMCVQSMNREGVTEFVTTRFGNVLGSNGSVIPHFKAQIAAGGPVTVTHPEIIRYFMTIPEACRLVLQAATMGHSGEILVFDMGEQVKIVDLAKKMIRLSGFEPDTDIKIEYTGLRPGEKLYEELLSNEENTQATQHRKIRVAQSAVIDIESLSPKINRLIISARNVDVTETVKQMKDIVPEFKSKNSVYERFDID